MSESGFLSVKLKTEKKKEREKEKKKWEIKLLVSSFIVFIVIEFYSRFRLDCEDFFPNIPDLLTTARIHFRGPGVSSFR